MYQEPETCIVVIGAGAFGLSTAYHLFQRGYRNISIVDRSPVVPAVDAASNDINRVVRTAYADPFYAELARDAIKEWSNVEQWGDAYHECGTVFYGPSSSPATRSMYANELALGCDVKQLNSSEELRRAFPSSVNIGSLDGCAGHFTRNAGWVNANQATKRLYDKVVAAGAKMVTGTTVSGLHLSEDGTLVRGVCFADNAIMSAELVIVATGAWTPSLFPQLELDRLCMATGQCVGMIQLSPVEADEYRTCPVFMDWSKGFYCFPPNEVNVMKFAIHGRGFRSLDSVSTPRTITDQDTGLSIPRAYLKMLREDLGCVYPDLATKPFLQTRLCWYNDSLDESFLLGFHPKFPNLMLASGDSGHAFKFLPVLGRLTADILQGKASPDVVQKLSPAGDIKVATLHERFGELGVLNVEELCMPEDLLGTVI